MTGFAPDLYVGTAEYYRRYRPRYPDRMLAELRELHRTSGRPGTLLDLACGPGQLAIPMARHFDRVLAVDLEPEMLAVGRAAAREAGIANIGWVVARAEELALADGAVDMVTIGSAFHRLDRKLVAARARQWLAPGGSLVVTGYGDPPDAPRPRARWQEVMAAVTRRWTGPPSEAVVRAMSGPGHQELLESAGYAVECREWHEPRRWTLDELVGLAFSISISSRRQLGDRAAGFEADLRSGLLGCDSSGEYDETLHFFAVIVRP